MAATPGPAFTDWLRAQLKAQKMSQRQLARRSGIDHSTISRLVHGDRTPSLGTAAQLARGLRELGDEADPLRYLGLMSAVAATPLTRVEHALRADEILSEAQVRQIIEYYLALRRRHLSRTATGADPTRPAPSLAHRATPSPRGPIGSEAWRASQTRVNGHDERIRSTALPWLRAAPVSRVAPGPQLPITTPDRVSPTGSTAAPRSGRPTRRG